MNAFQSIGAIVWQPAIEPVFIILIGVVLCGMAIRVYSGARSRGLLSGPQRISLMVLRLVAILGICAMLFNPMSEEAKSRRIAKRVALVAIDSSKSMLEMDGDGQATRLDTAKALLAESGILDSTEIGEVRLFRFDEAAESMGGSQLPSLEAKGETTYFHGSIVSMLEELRSGENGTGLFLLSDGHDFEMVPAKRTGQVARAKQIPIYPIALGKEKLVPDVSVNIASYQPHTFIRQLVQIQANVRLLGSASRALNVDLLREGELLRSRKLNAESGQESMVGFEVMEENPGQYEYEIRVSALPDEQEVKNNSAFTFINVTDAKIPVLLIEGAPHWDSTFLRRTLVRNARIDLQAIMPMGQMTAEVPKDEAGFRAFPLIILGRDCERVLRDEDCVNLEAAVKSGSVLVFARGNPGKHAVFEEMAPATWLEGSAGPVRVVKGRKSGLIVPLDVLASAPGGAAELPELPSTQLTEKPKTLAAVEAMAEASDTSEQSPAFVHRRHGRGQVLAVAVGGTWKWSLNPKSEASNNVYDRFWNQLVLNLIVQSVGELSSQASITMNAANISLGEAAHFSLRVKPGGEVPVSPRLTIFHDEDLLRELPLTQSEDGQTWDGRLITEKAGRYRGEIRLDGETVACRFAVYQERRETTETSADTSYLRSLAMASGGRTLDKKGLRETLATLALNAKAEADAPPLMTRRSLWDRTANYYLLFGVLGLEWMLRRRWGLT